MARPQARRELAEPSQMVPVTIPGRSARLLQNALGRVPGAKLISFRSGSATEKGKEWPEIVISEAKVRPIRSSKGEKVYVVLDPSTLSREALLYIGALAKGENLAGRTGQNAAAAPDQPATSRAAAASREKRWHLLREAFLRDWESVPAVDLARLTGSKSANPSARAYAWRKAGKIFSVNDGTAERFPLFQIKDGQPRPVIAQVLSTIGQRLSSWELALWFTTPHTDLGDWKRPVDLLDEKPDAVAEAARSSAGEIVY